jgi:hypothetical protein
VRDLVAIDKMHASPPVTIYRERRKRGSREEMFEVPT